MINLSATTLRMDGLCFSFVSHFSLFLYSSDNSWTVFVEKSVTSTQPHQYSRDQSNNKDVFAHSMGNTHFPSWPMIMDQSKPVTGDLFAYLLLHCHRDCHSS